jgi:outer membrane protein assembly factor BamB
MNQILGISLASIFIFNASAGNWPSWRGPQGTGVALEKNLPGIWNTNENVRWHTMLPGPGNSSPIVWNGRVFISQSIKYEHKRTLMCFDRADGKLLWQAGVTYMEDEPTQESNPYCSGTPATDGQRVIVSFGSAGLYCYDFDGKELWHRDLGKMIHMFGNAASPVLFGDLCFLNFGPDEKARLIAVRKTDGTTAWEAQPPKIDPSEQQTFGRGPGPGGPGGPGRGGFGPGMFVAPQILSQADKNGDGKLTQEEFTALAGTWFDKLDEAKTGKVTQEQLVDKLSEILPPPQGFGPPGGGPPPSDARPPGGPPPQGGRGGFGPGRFIGPGLFGAADIDKDGSLTRDELEATFKKWFVQWDTTANHMLTEDQLRDGLNAVLPPPDFGGPGGGGRGPGGPGGPGGFGGPGGPGGSWSTPVVVSADGHDELVVSFPNRVVAFDPNSGKQLWISKGLGGAVYTTPVWGESVLLATSTEMGGGTALALKLGGQGDVTDSHRLWRQERVKGAIGSGVIHNGHFFTIGQDGIATCYELKTGKKVWEERLKGPGARSGSWSSILLTDDKIYVPNQSGDVFVLRASPQFELLATNSLSEPTNSSLAASDGELFLRTDRGLWCIASKQ